MTSSWSVEQLRGRRGLGRGPVVEVVVEEEEGDQGHVQEPLSLPGELLWQLVPHQEDAAVPAPLHTDLTLPAQLT